MSEWDIKMAIFQATLSARRTVASKLNLKWANRVKCEHDWELIRSSKRGPSICGSFQIVVKTHLDSKPTMWGFQRPAARWWLLGKPTGSLCVKMRFTCSCGRNWMPWLNQNMQTFLLRSLCGNGQMVARSRPLSTHLQKARYNLLQIWAFLLKF